MLIVAARKLTIKIDPWWQSGVNQPSDENQAYRMCRLSGCPLWWPRHSQPFL